jgi:hypothetical protein
MSYTALIPIENRPPPNFGSQQIAIGTVLTPSDFTQPALDNLVAIGAVAVS